MNETLITLKMDDNKFGRVGGLKKNKTKSKIKEMNEII